MKKISFAGFGILIALIVITGGEIINTLLGFALTGAIPGTHYVAPYWLMMAIYCSLITLIVTDYFERALRYFYQHRSDATRKARLPQRRYSHL